MTTSTPRTLELARRLVAFEVALAEPNAGEAAGVARVCEKLRVRLATVAGDDGSRILLSRASALSRRQPPSGVLPAGVVQGCERTGRAEIVPTDIAVVAHLLGLLSTFIGEPLTVGLVRDVWPSVSVLSLGQQTEEGS